MLTHISTGISGVQEFFNYISSHLKNFDWKPNFSYCLTQKTFKQKFATVKIIN